MRDLWTDFEEWMCLEKGLNGTEEARVIFDACYEFADCRCEEGVYPVAVKEELVHMLYVNVDQLSHVEWAN